MIEKKKKVIIIGPAHPLRGGGMTTFNERMCRQFLNEGYNCSIYSFYLLYPTLLFPGTSPFTNEPRPEGIEIHSEINSISPLNWWRIGHRLRKIKPDLVIVRFWLPFIGPALGTIIRIIKKNKISKIIAITDNIIPHEKRPGDRIFTKYFLKACDAFLTMSDIVYNDILRFNIRKPIVKATHPIYDNFGETVSKLNARKHLDLPLDNEILLFFGFIRRYKGLDLLLSAVAILKNEIEYDNKIGKKHCCENLLILIAGEFYEDRNKYIELIKKENIGNYIILRTEFIPNSEVRYYLSACDGIIQPYRSATQSGVTPLAYHFEKPMIVTNVGSLPDMVPDGKVGIVCEPDPQSIAVAIKQYFQLGESHFLPQLRTEKQKYSWEELVNTLIQLSEY